MHLFWFLDLVKHVQSMKPQILFSRHLGEKPALADFWPGVRSIGSW